MLAMANDMLHTCMYRAADAVMTNIPHGSLVKLTNDSDHPKDNDIHAQRNELIANITSTMLHTRCIMLKMDNELNEVE